ncbi:MAG: hypothetical protein QOD33_89 [Pyrinomonadaceae bacterium]|nr:hypothetical protein [Pyrinomonadaceae bacterium]
MRRHFHVLPANAATPTRLQCFQGRFFCREARGIMLGRNRATTVAVGAFRGCEHAFAEAWRPQQHFANSRNFDNVYPDGNNHK